MQPSKDISRLIEIMAALRTPVTGCPWDLEQDFRSIAPYTIEEAFEVADAIERGDTDDLCEELGDLLLQVVYHARMAEEAELFSFGDVVEAITTKMIRRHPHVFGDEDARSAGMAKGAWERIKAEEKKARAARRAASGMAEAAGTKDGYLDDVPPNLTALMRALKLQQKAARVGFDWNEAAPILEKIAEETGELVSAMATRDRSEITEEYGDLLFAVVNLGRHLDVEPEGALRAANEKFRTRFHYIEKMLGARGSSLEHASLDEMEDLWQEAKRNMK
jgi:ATP diphosphatase